MAEVGETTQTSVCVEAMVDPTGTAHPETNVAGAVEVVIGDAAADVASSREAMTGEEVEVATAGDPVTTTPRVTTIHRISRRVPTGATGPTGGGRSGMTLLPKRTRKGNPDPKERSMQTK